MPATALLLVPPLLKIAYGPLLGPAMLLAAGRSAGHDVQLLDLNARWIREHLTVSSTPRLFVGDHDRPCELTALHAGFKRELELSATSNGHDAIVETAHRLAHVAFGRWGSDQLRAQHTQPNLIGVSVMYRDQVEPALAIAILARRRWPNALIIFGGAHVTALKHEIAVDTRYGALVDRFVFGYAERTWVELLDAVGSSTDLPPEAVRAGSGVVSRAKQDTSIVPNFDDLDRYPPDRLTIAMQTSRGCSYHACAYCTYPGIEGEPCDVPWNAIDVVIAEAVRRGAAISFKDSLLVGERLERLANRIAGRIRWSACTKLDADLPDRLEALAAGGCATLEIGLETTHPAAQRLIGKRQRLETFVEFIDAASEAGIAVVVNYMTGLPTIEPGEEKRCMAHAAYELERRKPKLASKLEHNQFQLERLSPMGQAPKTYGMRVVRSSPWSSVIEWELDPRKRGENLIKVRPRNRSQPEL